MWQRFWLCCGVHGSRDSWRWLQQAVARQRPDGILFAGGILDSQREFGSRTSPWSLTLADARFIKEFLALVGGLRVFSAVIPGLPGEPLEEFIQLGMQAELTFPTVHVAHATLIEGPGLAICGIGGPLAEKELLGIDSTSRTMAEYALRPLWTAKQPRKVLLLASPPPGPLGGPEAVPLVGELIDSYHPDLCVVRGSSQWRGSQRIGHTLVVNPGCLADGWAVWLDWSRPASDQVQFVNLRQLTAAGPPDGRAEAMAVPAVKAQEKPVPSSAIRERAYSLWEAAGRPIGESERFWLEAEKDLRRNGPRAAASRTPVVQSWPDWFR